MSPCDCCLFHVLWITLQMLVALAGPYPVEAMARFTPYVSEFTYAPDYHPSRNPKCPTRWRHDVDKDEGDPRANGSWNHRRSPEEGLPVGQEPSIEIRAVLVRCPKSHEETIEVPMHGNNYNITAGRSQDILEFHGFDRDEPAHHSEVRDCRRKLVVTMKFNNIGKTKTQEEFVVIDHVLDPVTMHKARLLNPFVVKVRQEPVLQLYGLKFQSVVNGEAKEEVINKKQANYTGCENGLKEPTCGQMLFHGSPIPYSQGFCCSCDPEVNAARQPSPKLNHSPEKSFSSMKPPCNKVRSKGHRDINVRSVFDNIIEDERSLRGSEEQRLEDSLSSAESISKDADRYISKFIGSQSREGKDEKDIVDKIYGETESVKNESTPILEKDRVKLKGVVGPTLSVRSISKDFQDEDPLRDDGVSRDKSSSEYSNEVISPILQNALIGNFGTKGKMEPYMDAVSRQALRERSVYSKWRNKKKSISTDGTESKDIDRDIIGEFKKSEKNSFLNHRPITEEVMYKKPLISSKNVNVTSELLKLEEEYEAFKKMSRRKAGPEDEDGGYGVRSISENDAKSSAEVTNNVERYSKVKKQPFVKEHFMRVTPYDSPASDSKGGKFENSYSSLSRPEVDAHGQFDVLSGDKVHGVPSRLRSDEISDRTAAKDSGRIPLGSRVLRNSQRQQDASSSSLSIPSEVPSTRMKDPISGRNSYRIESNIGRTTTQLYSWSMDRSAKSDEIESSTRLSGSTIDVPAKATFRALGSLAVQGVKLNSLNSTVKPSSTFLRQSTTKRNANLETPLILRQELVNDTVYPVSINNVTQMNGPDNFQRVNKSNKETNKKLHEDVMGVLARIIESEDGNKKSNDSSNYESSENIDYKVGKSDEKISESFLGDQDELIENLLRMALNEGESLEEEKSENEGTVPQRPNEVSNYWKEHEGGKFELFQPVYSTSAAISKFVTSSTERIENEDSIDPKNVSKVTWKDQRVIKDPLPARLNYSSLITARTNRHFEESNQKDSSNSSTQELSECSEKSLAKSSETLKNISRDITHNESPSGVTRNFEVSSKQLESVDQTDLRPIRILEPVKTEVEFTDRITQIENHGQSALGRLVYSGTTSGLVSGPAETVRLSVEGHSEAPTVEKLSCKEQRDKTKVNSRGESRRKRYRDTLVETNLESYVDLGTLEDWPKRPRKRSLWSEKAKSHESRSYADDLRDPDVESVAIDKGYAVPGKSSDRDSEESFTVLSGGFDLVKGNLRYEDQSATVINERRLEVPSMFTEQDYIFLDENGRERAATEPRLEEQQDGIREQVLGKYLKGSVERMGAKEDQENKQKSVHDTNPYKDSEKNFDRVDGNSKRNFRSINFENPLDNKENEGEIKIDKKIDEKFVEISKALKEASNDVRLTNRNEKKKISKDDNSVFRNFAIALNRIPSVNNFQRSNMPAKVHSTFRKLESGQKDDLVSYPSDGYRIRYVPLSEKVQKKTKPFFSHANSNLAISPSIVNPNARIASSTKAQLPVTTLSSTKTRSYKSLIRPSVTLNVNSMEPTIRQIAEGPSFYSKGASQETDSTLFTSPALRSRETLDTPETGRKYNDRHNARVTESSTSFMNRKNSNANGMEVARNITMEGTSKIDHKKDDTFANNKCSSGIIPQLVDIDQQDGSLLPGEIILKENITSDLVPKSELRNGSTVSNVTRPPLTSVPGQKDTVGYTVAESTLPEKMTMAILNNEDMAKSKDINDIQSRETTGTIQNQDLRIRHNSPSSTIGSRTENFIETEKIGSGPLGVRIILVDQPSGIKLMPEISNESITKSGENTLNLKSLDSLLSNPSDKSHETLFPKANGDGLIYREIDADPNVYSESNFEARQPEIEDDKTVMERSPFYIKPERFKIDDEEVQEGEAGSEFKGSFARNDLPGLGYLGILKSKMADETVNPSNFVRSGQKVCDPNVENKLADTVSQRREDTKEGLTWSRVAKPGFLDPGMKTSGTYSGSQSGSSITKEILYSTSPEIPTLAATRMTSPGVFTGTAETFQKNFSPRIPLHVQPEAPWKRSFPRTKSYYSVDTCNRRAEPHAVDSENLKIGNGSSFPESIGISTASGNMEDPNVYLRKYKFPQAVGKALAEKLDSRDVLAQYFNPKKSNHDAIIDIDSLEDADDSDFFIVKNYTNFKRLKRSVGTRVPILNYDNKHNNVLGDSKDTSYQNSPDHRPISHTSYLRLPVTKTSNEKGRAIREDPELRESQQCAAAVIKPVADVQEIFEAPRLKRYDIFGNSMVTDAKVEKNAKILSDIFATSTSNILNEMDDPVVSVEELPVFPRDEINGAPEVVGRKSQNVGSLGIKTRRFLQAYQLPKKSSKRRTHSRRGVNFGKKDNDRKKKHMVHSRAYRDAEYSLSGNNDPNAPESIVGHLGGIHARNQGLGLERLRKRFLLLGRKALGNKTRNGALTFYDYDYYPQGVGSLYKKKLEESRFAERKSNSTGETIVTTDDGVSNLVGTEAPYKLELEKDEWEKSGERTGRRNENRENLRREFKSSTKTTGTADDGISNLMGTEAGGIIEFARGGREILNIKKRNIGETRRDDEKMNINFDPNKEFSKIIFNDGNTNLYYPMKSRGNNGRKVVKRSSDSCHSKFMKHVNNEKWKAKMELLKLKKHADTLKEYLNWSHDVVTPEYLLPTDVDLNEEKTSGGDKDIVIRNGSDSLNEKSPSGIKINFAILPANSASGIGIDISNTLRTISSDEIKNKNFFENQNYENTTIEVSVLDKSLDHFSPQKLETTSKCLEETKTPASGHDNECPTGKILPACGTGKGKYEDRYEIPEEAMIFKSKDGAVEEDRYSLAKNGVGVRNGGKKVESLEKLVTLGVATHQTNRFESPISEKLDSGSLQLKNKKSHEHPWIGGSTRFLVKSEDSTEAQDRENSLTYGSNGEYNSSGITSLPLLLEILYSQDTTRNGTTELFIEGSSFDDNELKRDKNNFNNNFSSGSSILPKNMKFFAGTKNNYVDANVGGAKAHGLADDKERIILPDAGTLDVQEKRRFMDSMDNDKVPSSNLQNIKHGKGSIKNSFDIDNDAVIISLIEKDRPRDEKVIEQDQKLPEMYKIYEKEIPYEGSESLGNNQDQIRDPQDERKEKKNFRRNGRRILAIQKSKKTKYSKDITDQDYAQWDVDEDDPIAEDEDAENNNYLDSPDKRNEREKMKENWDVLASKIMIKEPIFEKRKAHDNVNDNDMPLSVNRSNMERLHFYDADKYINEMAKKISHYSNMHNFEDQDNSEKQLKDYKNWSTDKYIKERDDSIDNDEDLNGIVNGSNRNFREQDVDGSKDDSEVEEEVVLDEDVNDTPVERRMILRKKLEDFPGGEISINSRRLYPFMEVDREPDSLKSSKRKIPESSNVSSEDRTIDKKDVKPSNSTGNKRFSVADENDSDFQISLNGKIHIDGGTNGQPLSISIDAAPESANVNAQTTGSANILQKQLRDTHSKKVKKSKKNRKKVLKGRHKFFIPLDRNPITSDDKFVDQLRESTSSQKGNTKNVGKIFKRGNQIYEKNPSAADKAYSKFMKKSLVKNFGNDAKIDTSWSAEVDQESPSRILPVSSIVGKTFILPRRLSRKLSERMKKHTAHHPNLKSTGFVNNELDDGGIVQGSAVKIVKIIPVQFAGPAAHAVPGYSPENISNLDREQKSRLITSEMPKSEEEILSVTKMAGKIEPFDVRENEDESDVLKVTDKNDWRYKSDSSENCNRLSNHRPELCKNGFKNSLDESHGSVDHPSVNVKFMGLIGIEKPDLNQTDYEMLDEDPNSCETNMSKEDKSNDFDVLPLIRVKITQKKMDEPLIDEKTVLLQLHLNVTTESNQDNQCNQDSNQCEDNRCNSKQKGFPGSGEKFIKTATVKPKSGSMETISSSASGSMSNNDERYSSDEISKFPKFNHTMVEEIHAGPNQKNWPLSLDEFNYKNWLGKADESQRENQEKNYGNSDHEKRRFELNHSQPGNREGNVKSDLRSKLNFTNLESGNRLQDKLDAGDRRLDSKIKVPDELCDSKEGNSSPWCTTTLRPDDNTMNNVMNNGKKTAQVENMLAIMEFMKKVKNMMSGDNQRDENKKNDGSVIQLERVVLVPENQSQPELNDDGEIQIATDHIIMMGEGVKHDETDRTENPKFKEILNNKFELPENSNNSNREKSSSISNKSASGINNGNDKSFLFYRQPHRPSFLKSKKRNNISSGGKSKESKIKNRTTNSKFIENFEPKIKKVKGRSSHLNSRSRYSDLGPDPLQATNMENNPPEMKSIMSEAPKLKNFELFSEESIKLDGDKNGVPEKLNVTKSSANMQPATTSMNSSKFMTSDPDMEFKIFGNESDVQRISNDSLKNDSAEDKDSEDEDAESYNMRVHEKLKKEMMAKKLSEWEGIRGDLQSTSTSGGGVTQKQNDSKHNPENLELGKELAEFQKLREESVKREKELLYVVQKKINDRLHDLEDENLKEKSSQTKTDLTDLDPLLPLVLQENNNHRANDLMDVSNVNNHHSLASLIREESGKSVRDRNYEKLIDDSINSDKVLDLLSVPVDYSLTKEEDKELQDDQNVHKNSEYATNPDNSQPSDMDAPLGLNKAREFESEVAGTEDMKILSDDERRKDVEGQANNIQNEKREVHKQVYLTKELPSGKDATYERPKHARRSKAKAAAFRKKKKKRRHRKKKKHKKKKKKKKKKWWPFKRNLLNVPEDQDTRFINNFEPPGTASGTISNVVDSSVRDRKKRKKKKSAIRKKRQIRAGGAQVRGGQDCMDRRHPSNVNPAKYLESAHCLRFSDVWYSVYELENPIMEHTVYLQLYEKHTLPDGTTHWDDLTQGSMVRLGTFIRHQRDSVPTIVFTYSGARIAPQKRAHNLNPSKERLLVPSPVAPEKVQKYPALKGGSGEYLVVGANAISKDGNECDKAGVGFTPFAMQPDRCGHVKGTCLKNQPLAYWRHDMEAREAGRPGCYFLSNFASVPINPIKYNVSGSGSREFLGLEYHSPHVSAIDIEVRADYNAIVRVGSSGRVTEVYIDSTAIEHTVVTVVISNMGLASSPYQPRISDCPTGLPVSWTKAKGTVQVIPPQHDQRVTLDLYGQLYINGFHCSVEVVNHHGELVAMRRIRVQKMDRCFCVWHCLCACVGSVTGLGCQPMSPEHYHAAGFQGPVPVTSTEPSMIMNTVRDVLIFSALMILLLLLLGMLKWLIGIFAPAVGRWGLDNLLEGSKMDEYFEPELKCRCLVTDSDGVPVHPETGQRTVRICNRKVEFFLNLIFFLTYPIAICCNYAKRSFAPTQADCCPDESKTCLITEKAGCPKLICVNTYGDTRNSKMEAEDTQYVMNELKKSQESLQDPKRPKKTSRSRSSSRKSSHRSKYHEEYNMTPENAENFVRQLLEKRVVFRNLTEPVGELLVPPGTLYSVRGYFFNSKSGEYSFITPCPFKQHWLIDNCTKRPMKPPKTYSSNLFMRTFNDASDVYESNEISLEPRGICINVQYLDDR